MALTITELQAFIDEKPDVRAIVNEIADYLQANPPGGGPGGNTIYTGDGSLTGDRTINQDAHALIFSGGSTLFVSTTNYPGGVFSLGDGGTSAISVQFGDLDGDGNDTRLSINDLTKSIDARADNSVTFSTDSYRITGALGVGSAPAGGNLFTVNNGAGFPYIFINPTTLGGSFQMQTADGTANSYLDITTDADNINVKFVLGTTDGVHTSPIISGDAIQGSITYTADTHTFNVGMTISELAGVGTRAIAVDTNGKIVEL